MPRKAPSGLNAMADDDAPKSKKKHHDDQQSISLNGCTDCTEMCGPRNPPCPIAPVRTAAIPTTKGITPKEKHLIQEILPDKILLL